MSSKDREHETGNGAEKAASNVIDAQLLEILRCPLTHSRLRQEGDWLIAEDGGLRYPVRDGIPVMLIEEAQLPPEVASLDELKQRYPKRAL
jgi:uncharacterized protein YbaR (Trm112 family)